MAENVVGITLEAKIDGFLRRINEATGATADEAKAMATAFSKEIKAAENAAKKAENAAKKAAAGMKEAGDATKKAADKAKEFGDSAGKAGGSAAKLAGFLGMVSPEAAEAARGLADLADVGEVAAVGAEAAAVSVAELAAVLGPLVVVLGAAAAAYMVHNRSAELAAERTASLARQSEILTDKTQAAADAQLRLAVAEGRISESTARQLQLSRDATREVVDLAKGQQEERKAAEEAWEWNTRVSQSLEDLAGTGFLAANVIALGADYLGGFSEKADAAAFTLADLSDAYEDQREKIHEREQADIAAEKAAEKKRLEDEKARKAAEARAAAEKKLAEELARQERMFDSLQEAAATENERVAKITSGIQAMLDQADTANDSMLVGAEKITDEYEEQTKAIGEKTAALLLASKTELERDMISAASKKDLAALEDKYFADLDAQRKEDQKKADEARAKDLEETRKHLELIGQSAEQVAGYVDQVLEGVRAGFEDAYQNAADNVAMLTEQLAAGEEFYTDAQKAELKKRIKEQRQAARAAFEAQKIAAMSQAAINTALAVSEALSSAPWPYNLIPAGFALAGGIAQEAAIASEQPAFHRGGPLDMAPDEMSITARRSEYMVNPTGRSLLGDDTLGKANAGVAPSTSGNVYAVSVYKHSRQVDRWKSDGLLQGDPIAKAILAGKLVGHRSR